MYCTMKLVRMMVLLASMLMIGKCSTHDDVSNDISPSNNNELSAYLHKSDDSLVNLACAGYLYEVYDVLHFKYNNNSYAETAAQLHVLSGLSMILYGSVDDSIKYHLEAKALEPTLMPPLAGLQLQQNKDCDGLSDIFYSSAVFIKQMVDMHAKATDKSLADEVTLEAELNSKAMKLAKLSGYRTLITLCSDSGLNEASVIHMQHAISLDTALTTEDSRDEGKKRDIYTHDISLYIRNVLLIPPVYDSMAHVTNSRKVQIDAMNLLQALVHVIPPSSDSISLPVESYRDKSVITIRDLDEFALSPTFYFIYQGMSMWEAYCLICDMRYSNWVSV